MNYSYHFISFSPSCTLLAHEKRCYIISESKLSELLIYHIYDARTKYWLI